MSVCAKAAVAAQAAEAAGSGGALAMEEAQKARTSAAGQDCPATILPLSDMHCHLDFAANGAQLAAQAADAEMLVFANTVTPEGYVSASKELGLDSARQGGRTSPSVKLGLGLHPWWVQSAQNSQGAAWNEEALALFESLAPATRYLGEVGLDFGPRRKATAPEQMQALDRILAQCQGEKLISFHASKAEDQLLTMLQQHKVTFHNVCIIHWFSGSSDQLWRAIRIGCCFSVNKRMLSTKRGREYAKVMPENRLLLETDWPPQEGDFMSFDAWQAELAHTVELLAAARNCEPAALAETLFQNAKRFLC